MPGGNMQKILAKTCAKICDKYAETCALFSTRKFEKYKSFWPWEFFLNLLKMDKMAQDTKFW